MAVGATVVAISADSRNESIDFAARLGTSIPLLSDPGLVVALQYGVAMEGREIAVPATFVITSNGTIAKRWVGESMIDRPDLDEVLALIKSL